MPGGRVDDETEIRIVVAGRLEFASTWRISPIILPMIAGSLPSLPPNATNTFDRQRDQRAGVAHQLAHADPQRRALDQPVAESPGLGEQRIQRRNAAIGRTADAGIGLARRVRYLPFTSGITSCVRKSGNCLPAGSAMSGLPMKSLYGRYSCARSLPAWSTPTTISGGIFFSADQAVHRLVDAPLGVADVAEARVEHVLPVEHVQHRVAARRVSRAGRSPGAAARGWSAGCRRSCCRAGGSGRRRSLSTCRAGPGELRWVPRRTAGRHRRGRAGPSGAWRDLRMNLRGIHHVG